MLGKSLALKPLLLVMAIIALGHWNKGVDGSTIILISDLHLDLFYATPQAGYPRCQVSNNSAYGTRGCDSPLTLLQSMVSDIRTRYTDAKMTLFTGDWMRHRMHLVSDAADSTITAVANQLGQLPGSVVGSPKLTAALGNNDFIPDYYYLYGLSQPTAVLSSFATNMQNNSLLKQEEVSDFLRCAFFRRSNALPGLDVIVLNTLVWSESLQPYAAPSDSDPCGQFQFLSNSLAAARTAGRKVYILSHIPPTVNLYSLLHGTPPEDRDGHYWQDSFLRRYTALLTNYSDIVVEQLFGHTHLFAFMGNSTIPVPLFIIPSLSPIFGNTPSYLAATMDDTTFAITDLKQTSINMGTGVWSTAPSSLCSSIFGSAGSGCLTASNLQLTGCALATDDQVWSNYEKAYVGGGVFVDPFGVEGCDADCRKAFKCAYTGFGFPSDYKACMAAPVSSCPIQGAAPVAPDTAESKGIALGVVLVVVVIVAIVIGIVVYSNARRARLQREGEGKSVDDVEMANPPRAGGI
jgi:sphingomyelin phosphodiesterase acid-like 3